MAGDMFRCATLAGRIVFLAAIACSMAACLSSDTLINVRADGTGTIEQTILVNPKTIEMFAAMAGAQGGQSTPAIPKPGDMLDETKLKEAATRFGTGVRYVSSTPMKQGDFEGARALFAFDDVNGLNVSEGPQSGSQRPSMTFHLDRVPEGGAVLTITTPDVAAPATPPAAAAPAQGQLPPEALAVIKPLLQGLRIGIALNVEGAVVRTNAEHVNGSRVTLLDVDFGPLLANDTAFEKLARLGPGANITTAKAALKDLPGVTINSSPTILIQFR
jgi:hypothetical protein